jgi:hypothetical protein
LGAVNQTRVGRDKAATRPTPKDQAGAIGRRWQEDGRADCACFPPGTDWPQVPCLMHFAGMAPGARRDYQAAVGIWVKDRR